MSALLNSRKALVTLAVIVAVVAIVVPTCRMVGCSMEMGGVAPWGAQTVAGLFSDCGGEYVVSSTPVAVVPSGADSLTVALVAAVVAALALMVPALTSRPLALVAISPPAPPEPPLGVRLRL